MAVSCEKLGRGFHVKTVANSANIGGTEGSQGPRKVSDTFSTFLFDFQITQLTVT
jgi:hypothetical protein